MAKADIAVLLALSAALVSAAGSVIRQRSAQEITDQPVGPWTLFLLSLRDGRWWLGGAAAVANYSLQAAALSLGSVILVTALQVTVLLFALPINARLTRHRVTPREWMWAVLLAGAVATVITVGDPTQGQQRASLGTWMAVAAVMGPALLLCALGARIWSGAVAAVLLAVVAGSSLALFAVLTKGVVEAGEGGAGALLRAPELYAWLAMALAGMVFQQAAFRAGALTASLPTMTMAKPVVAWILGITVLHETLRADGPEVFALAAAVTVVIVATAALARGEAAAMEARATAIPVEARRVTA
ncbi:DMT family transporter [Mycobacterium sp. SM1]|uniref:DMT family transporter n=1 Tax=Mycobacterium sp. SM1 TaxID=2816243 RepID=UPI001BCFE59D|nr:DMT family transporter [Mycobacterium sp. SM1]MBS4729989.1 DMT family transporter [Mycobacterium sp. SM1]